MSQSPERKHWSPSILVIKSFMQKFQISYLVPASQMGIFAGFDYYDMAIHILYRRVLGETNSRKLLLAAA